MTHHPPSPRAREYLLRLAGERELAELGTCGEERLENVGAMLENGMSAAQASRWIDRLKVAPLDQEDVVGVGVYRLDGTIYVVRENRTNTRVHARRLIEIGGRRLTEADTVVQIEFEYAPEVLHQLRSEHMMTLEEARPFIIRYGRCIACGAVLSDATSVERGVGPVCIRKFAGYEPTPVPEVSPETSAQLAGLLTRLRG